MAVIPASTTTVPASSVRTTSATTSTGTTEFQTFLTMLTTQLKYQDPLDPIESADFAVQLATFSGVEQQVATNELLGDLVASMGSSGLAQLADWVGMEARAAAPAYYDGAPIALYPDPESGAVSAQVVARNAFNTVIGRYDIDVSKDPVSWSGIGDGGDPLPSGLYTFQVESFDATGNLLGTKQAEIYAPILEARVEGNETVLVLEGGTKLKSSAVVALR